MRHFEKIFIASAADIDELGHVNNAVWVWWVQDLATAHWAAAARKNCDQEYGDMVPCPGETTGETIPRGACTGALFRQAVITRFG